MTAVAPSCRACGAALVHTFVDLGSMPLANSYLPSLEAAPAERAHPLHVRVCDACLLVQIHHEVQPSDIFSEYAYFSSYSSSWLEHARRYAEEATARWSLGTGSQVVEIASNDGYLLKYFAERGIPVLGVEPAANVAQVAVAAGVPTEVAFLGEATAHRLVERGVRADLLVGNNVVAHVPDLNDFLRGLRLLLAPEGVLSLEFPHVLNLIQQVQFDTIYHEHFSYFSLFALDRALRRHGLRVFDVQQLPTHGGSLRVLACHADAGHAEGAGLHGVRALESRAQLDSLEGYLGYAEAVEKTKRSLVDFLGSARRAGRRVVAYGAAAKGNTLLNTCGIGRDEIDFVVDRNPHKQGTFLPGSHLEVRPPEAVLAARPDYVLILPWNLADEITEQMSVVRTWGGRFVVPVPETTVLA